MLRRLLTGCPCQPVATAAHTISQHVAVCTMCQEIFPVKDLYQFQESGKVLLLKVPCAKIDPQMAKVPVEAQVQVAGI